MDVWKRRVVVLDGCVVIELPPELKKDKNWGGEIDTDILLSKGVFINLMDVSSITIPTNTPDKAHQLRLTAKNGLFKFAFDTEKHLSEWNTSFEEAKNQAIALRSDNNVKKPLWAGENPLAHRCREEEAQWGIHYNVHHHLLQCCVFGEIDMIQYLVKHRGADVEYVLPHMPEGNTFFDIGDTALKVGYRFDRPEVTTLVQQIIDQVEKEEDKEELSGDFSKSYGSAVPICTPATHRNRSRSITSSKPTETKEAHADYSHVMITEKKKSHGFWEDREIKNLPVPEWVNMIPEQLFDEKGLPNILALKDHFFREGRLSLSCVHRIIRTAKKLFRREPNVINLTAPVNIFGDIHGQFYDLLTQLDKLEVPQNENFEPCLFLGDYVDRGMFSCEVVLYLLALKIRYPKKVFLLRGNHETRNLTEFFNFRIEALRKYNREVYAMLMDLFDYLPLASVVTNKQGRFFCLHGGLSPSLQYIEEIDRIHRIEEVPETGPMCDLLWCDPYRADAYPDEASTPEGDGDEGFDGWDSDDSEEEVVVQQALKAPSATGEDIRFIGNHVRGSGYIFGGAAAEPFLMDNRLLMIVRAHEVMNEGYLEYYFGRNDRKHPQVVTIFSAPNYCDMYGNDAAVMRIKEDSYEFMISQSVEHPYYLPDLTNAIHYTFPFIMENLSELMYGAVMFFVAPREDDEEEEKNEALEAKTLNRLDSLHSMKHLSRKARVNNERNMDVAKVTEAVGNMEGAGKFDNAKNYDLLNETNPLLITGGRNSVRSINKLKGMMILDQLKQQQKAQNEEKKAKVKNPSLASIQKKKELASAPGHRDRSFTVSTAALLPLPARKDNHP
uniref:Serine/threonine-protein phosphatase n=1 Tax=Paramoeba aestuarina TaxID=180227 RepID=A0A7S4UPU1_9EUKA|mmetsp:Transcript_35453/g.55296  ORF Transcript_35453/g.55296 Transcript_35453/m.55296 type:complete len:837 (+) Transcript_35453:1664-4174(+)